MRNYYSCGCYTSASVPILTRCSQHNGWVVCRTGHEILKPRMFNQGNLRICHVEVFHLLDTIKPVDFAFAYAPHHWFAASHQLGPRAFAYSRMELFEKLVQKANRSVIVVDPEDFGTVLYQAHLLGIDVDSRLVSSWVYREPLKYEQRKPVKTFKVACGLNTGPLPKFSLKSVHRLFDGLDVAQTARLLDMSCTHLDQIEASRPNATIIGIIEDAQRYARSIASRVEP